MKLLSSLLLILFCLAFCNSRAHVFSKKPGKKPDKNAFNFAADSMNKSRSITRALRFADSMRPYLRRNGYSSRLLFVADMRLHLYVKRFYAIRLDSHKIVNSFLVAHGHGLGSRWDSVVFSNVSGSLCSSKGKYKIGLSYVGEYGKGYKLHGLDASNNNALKRLVVFHSFQTQTEKEYSNPNYMSSGCPMLAPRSFQYCDSLIAKETKPVMMVIY